MSTGVMGTLTQMSMTDVMQMLDIGKKSARIDVHFDGREGVVHVQEGQIVRAVVDNGAQDGEAAFLVLCRQKEGFFRIQFGQQQIDRNVHRPTTFVLLEALRVIDEERAQHPDVAQEAAQGEVAPQIAERQEDRRYPVSMPVELSDESGKAANLSIEDISLGGAFVRAPAPLPRGERVTLRLAATQEPMTLSGRVVHTLDDLAAAQRQRAPGMGVQFEDLTADNKARLERLIDALAEEEIKKSMLPEGDAPATQDSAQLLNLVAEADFLLATGDKDEAKRVLRQAVALAPNDDDVRRRLAALDDSTPAQRAAELLESAESAASVTQSVEGARSAARLCPERGVLVRALKVFQRADASTDVLSTAEELLQLNPRDELALRTLVEVNVAARRWAAAARAGEALLRLRPQDANLRELLKQIVLSARRR